MDFLDRVRETSDETGSGVSVHLTGAYSASYFAIPDIEAVLGVDLDGRLFSYVIVQGADVEIHHRQAYDATARTLARGTPRISKVGGVAGTNKINLNGSQIIGLVLSADDITRIFNNAKRQAIVFG